MTPPPLSLPEPTSEPAGYAWLVRKYELIVLPNWRWTFIADRNVHKELDRDGTVQVLLPRPRSPASTDISHLLFALKNDGVSLSIWRELLRVADLSSLAAEIEAAVRKTPTGAYARRAWFLFEALSGTELGLNDVQAGNYVPLLDPKVHVTGPTRKHRRQRIDINLLGTLQFSPVLRWTDELRAVSGERLRSRIEEVVAGYDDHTVRRALSFLYTRETMASYEIEQERPPRNRAERFVALLQQAPGMPVLDEDVLRELQNAIVDPRFADSGWRHEQVYIGESLDLVRQRVHFVCPKPEDVSTLMADWLGMVRQFSQGTTDPILATACLSFAFVLLHPFSDGNGRLHRWLIHWGLSRAGVTPRDMVIPVSAVMLSSRREYDQALETFSKPLLGRVDYDMDAEARMTVKGDTADLYRHPDLTAMAEGLWRWLNLAVDRELPEQLRFLSGMDRARRELREVVDMPDRLLVRFIQVVHGNGGQLSKRKRAKHFDMLTDDEVSKMEAVVAEHFDP
ncbi:MAG TPA: Fic family protein [Myxococcota bacterium]|nr:Fic family protein [Myxococcota bacterium]